MVSAGHVQCEVHTDIQVKGLHRQRVWSRDGAGSQIKPQRDISRREPGGKMGEGQSPQEQ